MGFDKRCLLTGAAPYDNVKFATAMMAKLFSDIPSLLFLPNVSETDNLNSRIFSGMPGVKIKNGELNLNTGTEEFQKALIAINKAYNHPSSKNLHKYGFESAYLEKFLQTIKKFKSPYAIVNLLGPVTVSQILSKLAKEQLLTDKDFKKLFVQIISVKALWIIDKIKNECSETVPIIIFEEPTLAKLGNMRRENEDITTDTIINLLEKVTEKVKSAGALVGIQCFEKCDWSVPIRAGVDIISFDAYNNPNNLTIIPEIVSDFIRNGGMINWAIVPAGSEKIIKNTNAEGLWKRTAATFGGLIQAGVSPKLVYNSAIISVNRGAGKLPVIFAEKAFILSTQLASKIQLKTL